MRKEKIKLSILDDDKLFVQLLEEFINSKSSNILVKKSFTNSTDFWDWIPEETIDVLILDLRLQNQSGLEILEQLQSIHTDIKVIIMSTFYNRSFMGQMLKMGAAAFIPKDIDGEELIELIEEVYEKGHYFSTEQIEIMRAQLSPKTPGFQLNQKDSLSARELEVLELICQQLSTKEIADKMFISPKTVESHKSNLILKTGVKNTAGLIIYAVQNKIINPDELLFLDS